MAQIEKFLCFSCCALIAGFAVASENCAVEFKHWMAMSDEILCEYCRRSVKSFVVYEGSDLKTLWCDSSSGVSSYDMLYVRRSYCISKQQQRSFRKCLSWSGVSRYDVFQSRLFLFAVAT